MTEASAPSEVSGTSEISAATEGTDVIEDTENTSSAADTDRSGSIETAVPAAAPELAATVVAELAALREQVAVLAAAVERDQERAAFRESVVDRLHTENQQLRRGELEQLQAPARNGLIRLHDLARRAAQQCRAATDITPDQAAALLSAVADETVDVLAGVGVERFDPVPGEAYDPARHRPVATVPTTGPGQHHTVVEVRAAGFGTADKAVRRADVVLARHEPPAQTPEPPSAKELT